ncbi:MAG: hypothetical protein ACE5KQ_04580 [Thermoplasmata archaeon]
MRVWSRGLGRVELAADLNTVKTVFDGKNFYIVGRTEPPIGWDFIVRLSPSEMESIMKLMMSRHIGGFLSRFLGLRMRRSTTLAEEFQEATTTRTGVRPDQEYADLLKLAPPKQPAARRTSTRRRSLMPRRSEETGEPEAAEEAQRAARKAAEAAGSAK